MRIISGKLKRRKIESVPGSDTRPTSDRIRESVFNILGDAARNKNVLDLFAGTGALGIEALSRGATHCTFIDSSKKAFYILKKNIQSCGLEKKATLLNLDINKKPIAISRQDEHFNLVFMDPPYNRNLIENTLTFIAEGEILEMNAMIVIEHSPEEQFHISDKMYHMYDRRTYGKKTQITFLEYNQLKIKSGIE